jgi:hypothetical protein
VQLGEALAAGGLVMLVTLPIVYRLRAASMHVRERHALLWPTRWMGVPLGVLLIGVAVMLVASRRSRPSRSTGDIIDITAEEEKDADARTASRSQV